MPASHRAQILEGAIECVQTKGAGATTTRDIAAASNASLASIPYHFGSKEALLDEAVLTAMTRYTDHLEQVVFGAGTGTTPTEAFLDSLQDSRPLLMSLMESYVRAIHSPELRARVAEHRRALVDRIASILAGAFPDQVLEDTRVVAVLLLVLIDGVMMHWLVDPDDVPSAAALDAAMDGLAALARASSGAR